MDLAKEHRGHARVLQRPDSEETGIFVRSSFDLLDGVDITDHHETVPAELFDELFGNNGPATKAVK